MRRETVFFLSVVLSLAISVFFQRHISHAQTISNRSVLDWPTGVTVYKPEKCYNGFTIVVPYRAEHMFLIDMKGRVVHVWRMDPEGHWQCGFLELLHNKNWISFSYQTDLSGDVQDPFIWLETGPGMTFRSQFSEIDWNGNVVWRYKPPKGSMAHHDMARLSNGNTIMMLEKEISAPHISNKKIKENYYIEVTPENEIVWEWYTSEHFNEFEFSEEAKRLIYQQGGDCFHANTLEVLPGNELGLKDSRFRKENILSCQRNTNYIFIIDKQTKKIVWKWGETHLVGPHHPTMLHNGNILIYDNGGRAGYPIRNRFYTRLIEINPVTGNIVWEYRHEPMNIKPTSKFFSSSWGSLQRLPNGNTFSLDCHKGRLFEVSPQGEIVWEYISPFFWGRGTAVVENGIYRAYRYSYDDIPQADEYFKNTDGHVGVCKADIMLPKNLGLPSDDLP